MKTIQIHKIIVLLFVICVLSCNPEAPDQPSPTPIPTPTPTQCETRGAWIWASSIDSSNKRSYVLDKLLEANLNTIFVSIPSINNNHGYGGTDDFISFIRESKNSGLSVHAWMTNGWRNGKDTEADFRDPSEQEEQVQWVRSIMSTYGQYLDGIHLDYIRYPGSEAVNINNKMDAVTQTINKIHDFLAANYPVKYLTATSFVHIPVKSRGGSPPEWFTEWRANSNNIYSNNKVPYFMQVQQDPIDWISKKIVDGVMPMQYTIDDTEWNQEIDFFKSFNTYNGNDPAKTLMGLGWMSSKGYDAAGIVRKIKYGREQGMKGFIIFILFNHGYDDSPLLNALTIDSAENNFDAPFKNKANSCI